MESEGKLTLTPQIIQSTHTHSAPQLLAMIVYFSSLIITILLPNAQCRQINT